MKCTIFFCTIALLLSFASSPAGAQDKADIEAIHKLIDQYAKTEDTGDLMGQAKLMTADRVWIGTGGGRRTDQAMNMQMQQAQFDEAKKLVPEMKWFTESQDRLIKIYGNGTVAVASFYWYRTFVLPANTPMDVVKLFGSGPPPTAITLVLVKERGEWKIAHTHVSLLSPPPAGQ
jgi:ketosteroid isomerase-like protein